MDQAAVPWLGRFVSRQDVVLTADKVHTLAGVVPAGGVPVSGSRSLEVFLNAPFLNVLPYNDHYQAQNDHSPSLEN